MVELALLRHAPTSWNRSQRLQGRQDIPLGAEGESVARGWRLPPELVARRWYASPLLRCRETARLLGVTPSVEPRLIEAGWGEWEGERLKELRRRIGPEVKSREKAGLDFRPPGGESPRDVIARVRPFLAELAGAGHDAAGVTHKGVITAIYALATGWDYLRPRTDRLDWSSAQIFLLAADGTPTLLRVNLPLDGSSP